MNSNLSPEPAFVPPLSHEDMRIAVVEVLWSVAHFNYRLLSREDHPGGDPIGRQIADLLGGCSEPTIVDFLESSGREFGVTWEQVKSTSFAQTMADLYDYAYLGLVEPGGNLDLADESESRWAALALIDLVGSAHLRELHAYRHGTDSAAQLLRICETANARHILEGARETFMDTDTDDLDRLTIKQIALLSGMKEDSLRVLANPKRPNPLPTKNDGTGTYVTSTDAKAWLKARGRYLPLRPREAKHRLLDLAARTFRSRDEACDALDRHLTALASMPERLTLVRAQLKAAVPSLYYERGDEPLVVPRLLLELSALDDLDLVRRIGAAMDLDADLLTLRIEELLAKERLAQVDAAIQARKAATASAAEVK